MGNFEGNEALQPDAGVIPRFCSDLFKRVDDLLSQNPPDDEVIIDYLIFDCLIIKYFGII